LTIKILSTRKKIINLIKNGKKFENNYFKLYVLKSESLNNKPVLYVANISKKSIKKSSLRNLYKRRIKSVFHKLKKNLKNSEILIIPKNNLYLLDTYKKIEDNLSNLFIMV